MLWRASYTQQWSLHSSKTNRYIGYYKSLTDVNLVFTKNYFSIKEIPYSLRNGSVLKIPSTRSSYYGPNSIHFCACLLWHKLPNSLKESQSLPEFKYKIKTIRKIDCSCTICRSRWLIARVGFYQLRLFLYKLCM